MGQKFIQESPCPSDEWTAGDVLLPPRTLADHHYLGARVAFAGDGVGASPPQRTPAASPDPSVKGLQAL